MTEAAAACGRTTGELQRWCAVGRLRCDRVNGEWHLLEDDLHLAATLDEVDRTSGDRTVVSMAFSDERTGRLAMERLRRRSPVHDARLSLAPMSLDGTELVLVAGSFPADGLSEVMDVVHELHGVVVDRVDEARVRQWRHPDGPTDEVQSPYS